MMIGRLPFVASPPRPVVVVSSAMMVAAARAWASAVHRGRRAQGRIPPQRGRDGARGQIERPRRIRSKKKSEEAR